MDFSKSIDKLKIEISIFYFFNGGNADMISNFTLNNNKIILKNTRRIFWSYSRFRIQYWRQII